MSITLYEYVHTHGSGIQSHYRRVRNGRICCWFAFYASDNGRTQVAQVSPPSVPTPPPQRHSNMSTYANGTEYVQRTVMLLCCCCCRATAIDDHRCRLTRSTIDALLCLCSQRFSISICEIASPFAHFTHSNSDIYVYIYLVCIRCIWMCASCSRVAVLAKHSSSTCARTWCVSSGAFVGNRHTDTDIAFHGFSDLVLGFWETVYMRKIQAHWTSGHTDVRFSARRHDCTSFSSSLCWACFYIYI